MSPMPIREIEKLYKREWAFVEKEMKPGDNPLAGLKGDFFDIDVDIDVTMADRVGLRIRGVEIAYDTKEKTLTCDRGRADVEFGKTEKDQGPEVVSAELEPSNGRIQLRILVDNIFIEIYANNGEVFIPMETVTEEGQEKSLELFSEGGTANVKSLAIRELKSVW